MSSSPKINPDIFKTLLPGLTILEAGRVTKKLGYTVYCALNDGVQRPNTWRSVDGGVYVEIRNGTIYKVVRIVPLIF